MLITIFTPTYNRGYTLGRLYDSIKAQGRSDIEWVVVDDGSTDDTAQLISQWLADPERTFDLRSFRQENAGKHVAWNRGLAEARGEIFFPVDSDDYLTPDAIADIVRMAATVGAGERIIAVSGVRSFPEGKNTGGVLASLDGGYLD